MKLRRVKSVYIVDQNIQFSTLLFDFQRHTAIYRPECFPNHDWLVTLATFYTCMGMMQRADQDRVMKPIMIGKVSFPVNCFVLLK